jgi:DnaK suppressor protein
MATMIRSPRNTVSAFEARLTSQRDDLAMRIYRHRMDVVSGREPDDETAQAVENTSRDMLAATLERERRTLKEIETALIRIKNGEFGICGGCGAKIPKARLDALPWARLCVHCAEPGMNSRGLRMAV